MQTGKQVKPGAGFPGCRSEDSGEVHLVRASERPETSQHRAPSSGGLVEHNLRDLSNITLGTKCEPGLGGFGHDLLERGAGFASEAAGVFVFGGETGGGGFYADGAVGSLDLGPFAGLNLAFGGVEADSKGGGFAEQDGGEGFAVGGVRDDLQEDAGASFFHLRGDDKGVEGSGFEEEFEGVGDHLGAGVVYVGFDDGDGGGFGGA